MPTIYTNVTFDRDIECDISVEKFFYNMNSNDINNMIELILTSKYNITDLFKTMDFSQLIANPDALKELAYQFKFAGNATKEQLNLFIEELKYGIN